MAVAISANAEVMYLLDTNIISELRRPRPHAGLVAWLSGIAPEHRRHCSGSQSDGGDAQSARFQAARFAGPQPLRLSLAMASNRRRAATR
jgi:hypothetical protein